MQLIHLIYNIEDVGLLFGLSNGHTSDYGHANLEISENLRTFAHKTIRESNDDKKIILNQ